MKIKRFEVFEKFTQDEADELKSLFYSIIDTVGDTYQVRADDKILDDSLLMCLAECKPEEEASPYWFHMHE